jgi:hypothetical protein
MKLKVEGSSPLSSVLTLLLYLSTLFHRVLSLVCPALILVSPPHLVYRQLGTSRVLLTEPDRAGQPGTTRRKPMSPKDKKATAAKATNDPSPPARRTPIPARSH